MDSNKGDTVTREEMDFSADARYLSEVRRTVERFASGTSLQRTEVDDFLTAVDEAVANAIRHGSPHDHGSRVHVLCERFADAIRVEVRDQGNGFAIPSSPKMPSPEASGGRGLPLMCALADRVEVASTDAGTVVTLQKLLR